jgi:nitroreductase
MDVLEAIRTRRSVRKYKPTSIPDDVLGRVLEAVSLAPSAKNFQPWKFILIRDPELKAKACPRRATRGWGVT